MAWRRNLMELLVRLASLTSNSLESPPVSPDSIFVLRNGGIGDLLVITPLFECLKNRYPETSIVVGVGDWNIDTLRLNPCVSEVLPVNAPWYHPYVKGRSVMSALSYIYTSPETGELAKRKFDIGIDVLGSNLGSLLLMRAGIGYRIGVRGYAGGHSAVQQFVDYNPEEYVGRSALRFAELLGAKEIPSAKPRIYLDDQEIEQGKKRWGETCDSQSFLKIVVAPGGGYPGKCWSLENYKELIKLVSGLERIQIALVGIQADCKDCAVLEAAAPDVANFSGRFTIRETFGLIAASDLVICNSSMAMHAAAAFSVPAIVLLGDDIARAAQHARQWAYADNCYVLGKDEDRKDLFSPSEVFARVKKVVDS